MRNEIFSNTRHIKKKDDVDNIFPEQCSIVAASIKMKLDFHIRITGPESVEHFRQSMQAKRLGGTTHRII
jgi:hypothetical protein